MGREKIGAIHERYREDALAVAGTIKEIAESVPTIVKAVPWAVVLWWTYSKLREPIRAGDGTPAIVARLTTATAPYWVLLGGIYQGLQGVAVALGGASVSSLVAMMELKTVTKADPAAEPFPGDATFKQLDRMDALYLASMLPLILLATSGGSVDTSRGVLEG